MTATATSPTSGRPVEGRPLRVLFSVLRPTVLKNFESVVRLLAARGHEVELAVHSRLKDPKLGDLVPSLVAEERVSLVRPPKVPADSGAIRRAALVRSSLDYLRYLDPRFSAEENARLDGAPAAARYAARLPLARSAAGRRILRRALLALDGAAPASRQLTRYLERRRPDIVLFTPYVERRMDPRPVDVVQPELLRAARRLRIPTVVCVASWDHLTLKSSLCPQPDTVFVWNELQRHEAYELHSMPPDRVVVTGAQCYDEWFGWTARPRAEFCARAGLDPARPYVLYTCLVGSRRGPSEVDFVLRWIDALRSDGDPRVAELGVLVRPHPARTEIWRDLDVSHHDNVVVYPREHGFPTDAEAKSDYYDSISHSSAVVGLNTSAMLEAGVVGRPVFTVLEPQFARYQMHLPHFRYLLEVGGGLIQVSDGLAEHVRLLGRALGPEAGATASAGREFVREFLRPRGLGVEATPVFVDELERLGPRVRA